MEIKTVVAGDCGTNCYLLSGEDFAIIIDPGARDVRISDFAHQNLQKPNKAILLTHCHFDHIGAVNTIKSIWNCPVIIGEQEIEGLKNPNINFSVFWGDEVISIIADKGVAEGDILKIGSFEARVLHTPGHTAGSVCYLIENILFSGDTLFNMSIGRTDLPTGSYATEIASLKRLLALDENTTVYSGHGPETTILYEKTHNTYIKEF